MKRHYMLDQDELFDLCYRFYKAGDADSRENLACLGSFRDSFSKFLQKNEFESQRTHTNGLNGEVINKQLFLDKVKAIVYNNLPAITDNPDRDIQSIWVSEDHVIVYIPNSEALRKAYNVLRRVFDDAHINKGSLYQHIVINEIKREIVLDFNV